MHPICRNAFPSRGRNDDQVPFHILEVAIVRVIPVPPSNAVCNPILLNPATRAPLSSMSCRVLL
eukprot:3395314-Rhodomonas_salina.1